MYPEQPKYKYSPKKKLISMRTVHETSSYQHKFIHMHDKNELLLITTETKSVIFSNGNRHVVHTPALILHRAGSYHSIHTSEIGDYGYSSTCIFYDEAYIRQIPESFLHRYAMFQDDCLIIELTTEQLAIFQSYTELLSTLSSSIRKQLYVLLLIIEEAYQLTLHFAVTRLNSGNQYIFEVANYLVEHFNEQLTTGKIAANFYVSVSKLNADFQKVTGQTIKSFYSTLRLNQSKELLKNTKLSIAEIAYQCGFSSESYFIQTFQKHLGTTPNSYRKQHTIKD